MTDRKSYRFALLILCLTSLVVPSTFAGVIDREGWLHGEAADKAIELATEKGLPVAIMYAERETSCPKCLAAARKMFSAKSTGQMVRVIVYTDGHEKFHSAAATALLSKAHEQTKDPSGWLPDLYFVMPDGRALGFVPHEDARSAEAQANKVAQIADWIKGVAKTLEKADQDVEKGRYDSAIKALDKIMEQDVKISHLIQVQLRKIDADEEMPETPVAPFFAGLKEKKLVEYNARALQKLAEAEVLIDKEQLQEAQQLLRSLAGMPESFDAKAQAQQLRKQVEEKLKSS